MIEVEKLQKRYGDLQAVDSISLTAQPGQIFGLLGPNGAGKSTTIGCISGLIKPSGGTVRVLGYDIAQEGPAAKEHLGVVPQELALYEDLPARENLVFWGSAYGLRGSELKGRVDEALQVTGLFDRAGEKVKQFSGGMKRRLNFAAGIVHRPRVLLLDEPTVGVDPQSRVNLLELVRAQAAAGQTVLYTTHYMEEAEILCDRLAIIDHGRIIAAGTLSELRGILGESDMLRLSGSFDVERIRTALAEVEDLEMVQVEPEILRLAVREGTRKLPRILALLHSAGADIRETTLTQPTLESLFIKLTGKELRE